MPDHSPIADLDPVSERDIEASAPAPAEEPGSGASESTVTSGEFYDAVAQVVKVIRPAVQADQGDIFLRGVDEDTGVVSVELVGACVTCPASTQTLKQGLERILTQRVEGVTSVVHVGEALVGYEDGTAVSL